jgi:16S rRNA processing protein RimM
MALVEIGLIEIGRIVRPHGFQGAFIAACPSGSETALPKLKSVLLGKSESETKRFDVLETAWMPRGWKVRLSGIDTDVQVKEIIGQILFAERASLPNLENNEHYVADLVGAPVLDAQTGEPLGKLEGVEPGPLGQDRWWVRTSENSVAVPATKHFIKDVRKNEATGLVSIWIQNFGELL